MTNIMVFIAFLDNLAQQPLISPFASYLGASTLLISVIVGAYSGSNIAGNLIFPTLLREVGLKRCLIIGFSGVALSLALYAIVQSPAQLLTIRISHGFFGGIIVPGIFTLVSLERQQDLRMSQVGRIIALAALLGPPSSGLLQTRFGFSVPFLVLAAIFVIALPLVSGLKAHSHRPKATHFSDVLSANGLRIAYGSAFALMYSMGMLAFWFPLHLTSQGLSLAFVGLSFATFAATASLIMYYFGRRGIHNPTRHIVNGFGLISLGLLALFIAPKLTYILGAMSLYGLGFGLVFPAMNVMIIRETDGNSRARAFAIFHGFFSLAILLAPIIGGLTHKTVSPFINVVILVLLLALIFRKPCLTYAKRGIAK